MATHTNSDLPCTRAHSAMTAGSYLQAVLHLKLSPYSWQAHQHAHGHQGHLLNQGAHALQTVFVQCGEPPRAGLLDALGVRAPLSLGHMLGSQGSVYHAATSATEGFLDEIEYRSMMARYGL